MRYLFAMVLCLATLSPLWADAPVESAPSAAADLAKHLAPMETMRGEFYQETYDTQNVLLQKASGEFFTKRPRKLSWHTVDPYEHNVITDGKVLWIHDIDLEQATRRPFSNALDQAPALLLSGDISALERTYYIDRGESDNGGESFKLIPRRDEGVFQSLTITFKDGKPEALDILDHLGQRTSIRFLDLISNSPIADSLFAFTPPEGTDVVIDE